MAFHEYTPHDDLYQYTNISGFRGILASKSIWFSDLTKTNDPREINLGHSLVMDAIKMVRHEDYPGSIGFPISILAGRLAGYIAHNGLMSCSFTHDSDSLPMWNSYSDNYRGVCIGFRATAISAMPIRIGKVRYLPEVSVESLRLLIRELLEPLIHLDKPNWEDRLHIQIELVSAIVHCKHQTWAHENEVRGSHAIAGHDDRVLENGVVIPSYEYEDGHEFISEVKTRIRDGEKVSFVALPFGRYKNGTHDPSRAISRVVLGPQCEFDEVQVAEELEENGFRDFEVTKSECRIR